MEGHFAKSNCAARRRERERTPPEVRLQKEKEQELRDLERTVRTVMVMNLNLRAEERDIFDFFGKVGYINDIKIIRDKNTKRSKGIAYIEFSTVESAINAVTLNGQPLLSMPVLVKPSEAEKVRMGGGCRACCVCMLHTQVLVHALPCSCTAWLTAQLVASHPLQNLAWEAQQQAKMNQQAATHLLNKMGGTAPGVKLNPIKLQVCFQALRCACSMCAPWCSVQGVCMRVQWHASAHMHVHAHNIRLCEHSRAKAHTQHTYICTHRS